MPLASSAGLLAMALLAVPPDAELAPRAFCAAGDLRVELGADATKVPVLCIHPEMSTNLFFDAKLARVELEGRERFRRVLEGDDGLTLVPSEEMHDAEPVHLTIYFRDGAAPASANFLLVMHPALAARQVDVIRLTRPVAFYKQAAREAEDRARQCDEDKVRMRAEYGGPGGLRGLRLAGLMDEQTAVAVKEITDLIKRKPRSALDVQNAWSYRAKGRVMAELQLVNPGPKPWTPVEAVLRGPNGEELKPLPLWKPEPILLGPDGGLVMVEVEATKKQAQGAYTLTLWDADRRAVTLENVTFPQ
ncbi:DUF2381 family protein [Archangium minus]|uniref:DUF2381 family protein n=1 Tax=Archangium minus TaxID=83450 RepID=A0ABY9X0E0_9BACT|nr:DUF2381 family protein [Archangium minus]